MTQTPKPPETVEPGQQWRDNDQRSKGAGEFTIVGTFTRYVGPLDGVEYATVKRSATGRHSTIRVDRLLAGGRRGYTFIGRKR